MFKFLFLTYYEVSKMNILLALTISIPLTLIASYALACDDKACEEAYLSATSQYIDNHGRQAQTARTEREAHALNRERRDYAVQNHIHRVKYLLSK
jgi:hypothetical protein